MGQRLDDSKTNFQMYTEHKKLRFQSKCEYHKVYDTADSFPLENEILILAYSKIIKPSDVANVGPHRGGSGESVK